MTLKKNDICTMMDVDGVESLVKIIRIGRVNDHNGTRLIEVQGVGREFCWTTYDGELREGGPREPDEVVTKDDAEQLVAFFIVTCKLLFHPDDAISDYGAIKTDGDWKPTFSDEDASRLDAKLEEAHNFFGADGDEDIYSYSMRVQDFVKVL